MISGWSDGLRFSHVGWLAGAPLCCSILYVLWRRYDKHQLAALGRFIAVGLRAQLTRSVSTTKRRLQRGLVAGALALLCVALAGPQLGFRWEQVSRRGNDVVFALDTSRSMTTPDMKPDRLTRAKLAIDDFVSHLDGDAVGIVAFAGTSFLVCPITLDYGAFHESLSAIDTHTIPRGGTNISTAIQDALSSLRRRPGSDKILILVTDGEDLEGSALDTARAAAQQGLKIYTVGVGTTNGDLIPQAADQGGGFVKDDGGNYVKSHLDEAGLKSIAEATGGFYVPLGTQGEGLQTIYQSILSPLAKHDLASRQQKIYTERYQWPLATALLALLASLTMGTRRRRPRAIAATTILAGSVSLIAILAGSVSLALPAARADAAVGNDPLLQQFNAGTEAYRAGQYAQAAKAFQQSIGQATASGPEHLADQEDAYYNLGNTLYRSGQKTEQSAPQETIQQWTDAVKAYETALQLRAGDADSKYNRDYVQRKLDQLKQQQNQQNKNKQNNKNNQNKDNQGKGDGQGGQGQGSSQQPSQGQPPQGQPPSSGEPPPGQSQSPQGQAPQGQAPQSQQPQGQQQPANQPPAQQPQGQQPQDQQPQRQSQGQKSAGQPTPAQGSQPPQSAAGEEHPADDERQPGQMSREEARELLDSVKGDERHMMRAPLNQDPVQTPDKSFKDW